MRYTALTTALIALMASLSGSNAAPVCSSAPAWVGTTNRPYSGYKYADGSWDGERAFEARYADNMVQCVQRCRDSNICNSIGYQDNTHNCDMYRGYPSRVYDKGGAFCGVATYGSCSGAFGNRPCCAI